MEISHGIFLSSLLSFFNTLGNSMSSTPNIYIFSGIAHVSSQQQQLTFSQLTDLQQISQKLQHTRSYNTVLPQSSGRNISKICLQSLTKIVRLAPPATLFNVDCNCVCLLLASTAWHDFFRFSTSLIQREGRTLVIWVQRLMLFELFREG